MEEAKRVLPVIRALAQRGAIVSVDTRHVEVAKAAVRVGASIVNDVTGFTDPKMVEFVKNTKCGVIIMHAGEVTEPVRAHKAVQLDTSAAAFVAEKARAAAEAAAAAAAPGAKKRGRAQGGMRLTSGLIQPQLPFADIPNGSGAEAEGGDGVPETDAASTAEAVAAQLAGASIEAAAADTAPAAQAEPEDRLAAMMARSARHEEAYVSTSQLRRFTLPDSAPIMRRVMGFLSDQARALVHAGVSRDRICIDPGAGFGKNANEDIIIQRETAKMASLGYPLLCAVSRKRFVGAVSGVEKAAPPRRGDLRRVPGRHPERRQHRARARRRRVRPVPERVLGRCAPPAPPRVRGARLQPGAPHGQHPGRQGPHRGDPAHLRVQLLAHLREPAGLRGAPVSPSPTP